MDEFLILLAIVLLAAVVGCVIGLPIVAVLQGRRIARLQQRLEQLEQRLAGGPQIRPADVLPAAALEAPAPAAAEAELVPVSVVEPVVRPAGPAAVAAGAESVETWLGRHALGWAAVILMLFATAFFLKQVFDNHWIGETGRVALGVAAGIGLCLAGLRYEGRFRAMLTSGGIVILYLATFAAFGYYHLLPQQHAGVFLVVLVAETALLALVYDAPSVALMAVLGGLLAPVLLRTDHDQFRSLFLYLLALDAGVVAVCSLRPWPAIATVALAGSQALFWGWYADNYHPEKLPWALGFQAGLFGLMLLQSVLAAGRRGRTATLEDLLRQLLNAGLFFGAVYVLLEEDHHALLGGAALVLAVIYTGGAWLALRCRPDDLRQAFGAVVAAMGFVAVALPLQSDATWVAVGWAVQGAALWWIGCRIAAGPLRWTGVVMLALAVGRLVVIDTPQAHAAPFWPLANGYALPAFAVAAALIATAVTARRFGRVLTGDERIVARLVGLASIALVWWVLSFDVYDYFLVQQGGAVYDTASLDRLFSGALDETLRRTAQMSLSVVWALYASIVLALGFRLRSGPVRCAALAVFAITLAKVLLVDLSGLPGFYRVAALFALALTLGVAAWAYQKTSALTAARLSRENDDGTR